MSLLASGASGIPWLVAASLPLSLPGLLPCVSLCVVSVSFKDILIGFRVLPNLL